MKVGLIDVDGSKKFPNLALMKISAYHKSRGDTVEMLEAHEERVNYRWNVTAECSECCNGQKEIWAGFFPGVPAYLAKSVALQEAEQVKLSNYCPNCGAKMGGWKE